ISAVDNTTKGPSGLAVIRGEGAGATSYSLTINGNGATISRSTSPGTPDFRIFTIDWDQNSFGAIVIVSNLTISNGRISTGTAGDGISYGGGILIGASSLKMTNCTISNNMALQGGGISSSNCGLQLIGCTLTGNSAAQTGGAIESDGN